MKKIVQADIDQVVIDETNCRLARTPEAIAAMEISLELEGQKTPIDGRYLRDGQGRPLTTPDGRPMIGGTDGGTRLLAARNRGWKKVLVMVEDDETAPETDTKSIQGQLAIAFSREGLVAAEIGKAIDRLLKDNPEWTLSACAMRVQAKKNDVPHLSKCHKAVRNLPEDVLALNSRRLINDSVLFALSDAAAAGAPGEKVAEAARRAAEGGLTAAQVKKLLAETGEDAAKAGGAKDKAARYTRDKNGVKIAAAYSDRAALVAELKAAAAEIERGAK